MNTSDRLYFSKYALDSDFNDHSNELDLFEFGDNLDRDYIMRQNNFDEFVNDIWKEQLPGHSEYGSRTTDLF